MAPLPADSETFVASVVSSGATTLLAGVALPGLVPDDLLEACRRHRVTLIEVPIEVAFADITEYVAATQSAVSGARLSASLVRQRQLVTSLADGRSLDELAARIAAEVGHDCRVLTTTGRHVVPGPDELDDATLDELVRCFLIADRLPAVARAGASTYTLFPVGSALGSRLTARLVAVDGDLDTGHETGSEAVRELCAIAAPGPVAA
ncbi:PucR family transcriptional regulator ligand-binding domain-containing protein [Nocardioides sp. B-3]|uniref:PucR family transcriptional regulator ligand-binding domain-containing protein n=1 Tax=Nocardioides sp. B-3 TaxID=2895565 RepID=UPI0021520E63|nr:PucR family transcriptional regulator ligand-binding domain-containing protein [Nocardioides sp. B-3]UUZ59840.1 PucR family transcriptional regulator ligand-binding domain-containing protein [Nocardioides sp. B-3]